VCHLEKGGDRIGCDTPVRIGNECLEINIASSDALRVGEGERSEGSGCGKLEDGLGRGQEELKD
jgi:hypothetical protein